jgi:hypothetical protein
MFILSESNLSHTYGLHNIQIDGRTCLVREFEDTVVLNSELEINMINYMTCIFYRRKILHVYRYAIK